MHLDVLITALDDSGIRVFGALRKTSAGVVHVTVPVPLAAQTRVMLVLSENVHAEGEIAACEKHESTYFVDVKVNELRREPRFCVNDPARVIVVSVPDYPPIDALVSNLSKSGIAVTLPTAIPAGCQVKIELADGIILGEVRYCKKAGDEFSAGIATETVLFREKAATENPEPGRSHTPGSLWSALKRLYKGVTS